MGSTEPGPISIPRSFYRTSPSFIMVLLTFAKLALVTIFLASLPLSSVATTKCTEPAVRKEWRKLSTAEKADWIQAVNVGCQSMLSWDC